jgi:hypothetical protein
MNILSDPRPKVRLPGDNYLLSDTAREAGKILSEREIFARAGLVFTVNETRDGFSLVTPEMLRTWLEDHMILYRQRTVSDNLTTIEVKRTISQSDASGILASPQFLKCLQRVERFNPIRMPAMDRWGQIRLLDDGYDEYTKSFTCDSVPLLQNMPIKFAKLIT